MCETSQKVPGRTSSPSCDGYYILMILYMIYVPAIITIVSNSYIPADWFGITVPILVSVITLLYSYVCIRTSKLNKPDNLFGLYLPMIAFIAWQLFTCVISNLFKITSNALLMILYGFTSLNFYGLFMTEDNWTKIKLYGAIYTISILSGFIVGERLAYYKSRVVRTPFQKKHIVLSLICSISLLFVSEVVQYYRTLNIVEYEPIQPGYGFAYERGLSSTDLEPYYVENEGNRLAKLDNLSTFIISNPDEMPVLDGAEAAYPIYSAFANACYQDIAEIQTAAKEQMNTTKTANGKNEYDERIMPVRFNNSVIAYESLLKGETDIFFGAKPSVSQQQLAEDAGKTLVLTPIGKEAFVFFVNAKNPVDGLTSQQIRDIYSGEINNWHKVGGKWTRILAFQRPANSGSQTMMEYFMGDLPLREPLKNEYIGGMFDLITRTANYQNRSSAIGYSFRYFASIMISDTGKATDIKFLKVDGIYPDEQTISAGTYPITTELYAVTLADNPNENVELFLEWMTGDQGQQIVADTGYVSFR